MSIPPTKLSELLLHFDPCLLWAYERVGGSLENEVNAYEYRQNHGLTDEEIDWIVERLIGKSLARDGFAFAIMSGDSYYSSSREGERLIQLTKEGLTEAERLIRASR